MAEIAATLVPSLWLVLPLVAVIFSARRIAVATASFMAFRNNDRDMMMLLVTQTTKDSDPQISIKDALKLLPKSKSDE